MKNKPGYIDNESKYNGIFNAEHKLCPALKAAIFRTSRSITYCWLSGQVFTVINVAGYKTAEVQSTGGANPLEQLQVNLQYIHSSNCLGISYCTLEPTASIIVAVWCTLMYCIAVEVCFLFEGLPCNYDSGLVSSRNGFHWTNGWTARSVWGCVCVCFMFWFPHLESLQRDTNLPPAYIPYVNNKGDLAWKTLHAP